MNDIDHSPGHNERAVRLHTLANEAQIALDKVARGESDAIEGWLAYGAALNEGRNLFPGDREFGKWVHENVLCQVGTADSLIGTAEVSRHERTAAMWAAANDDQFAEARTAGNARTVRGIYEKWKEIEAERENALHEAEDEEDEDTANIGAKPTPDSEPKTAQELWDAHPPDWHPPPPSGPGCPADQDALDQSRPEYAAPEAEAPPPEDVAPEDPAAAKLRREYRSLTAQAQEDDWIGMRAQIAEQKRKITAHRDDIDKLKSRIKELTEDNQGRVIGNLQRRLDQSEGRSKEHQANAARLQRQVNAQKAEIARLRKSLENQEVEI